MPSLPVQLPMPVTDSMFLLAESRNAPMHVGLLQVFDPPEDAGPDGMRELYEQVLADADLAPVYRQRPVRGVGSAGQWAWETDSDIDLRHHLRHSALPRPGRPRDLFELTGRLHGTLLDRERPLWEAHLIEGLDDGRFAVYSKVHHSLLDGVSAMKRMLDVLTDDPAVRGRSPFADNRPPRDAPGEGAGPVAAVRGAVAAAAGAVTGTVSGVATAMGDVAGLLPAALRATFAGLTDEVASLPFQAPRSILNASVSSARRFAGQSWPIERLRAVATAAGPDVTVNDVVLAMSSGALRSYLQGLGALPDAPLVAMVPVNLRTGDSGTSGGDSGAGNAVGVILCNLGTDLPDAGARLERVHASMAHGKAALSGLSPAQVMMLSAVSMAPLILNPTTKAHTVTRPPFNIVISNVPGPRTESYWNGARLDKLYPLSIPMDGQALNITVTSTATELGFGLVGCRRAVPHLQRMLGHLDEELAALEQAVGA